MALEKRVGARIAGMRKSKDITQKELAAKIGTSVSYLSNVETGKVTTTVKYLHKIAEALGVGIASFFQE